jgi:nitrate reductase gamma subunit
MRDQLLFAVTPYIVALAFVPVCAARYALCGRQPDRYGTVPVGFDWCRFIRAAWWSSLAVVALGHVLAFGFPDYLLLWNRQLFRLAVLEVAGVAAGTVASAGLLATLVRLSRTRDRNVVSPPVDVITQTLALVGMLSGVGIAIVYRWGSSWSEVTLVPYLYSLARFEPSPVLVTHLPLLVKLHVACAFAVVGAFPFTDMARRVIAPVDRLGRSVLAPVCRIACAACCALAARITGQVPALCARLLRNGTEEN